MTTRWKLEKMHTRLRASRFLFGLSALKTYDSSQISIYTLLIYHCLSVQYVHDCVRNTRDMVLFIILTRKQETWRKKWYRASGESEPKLLYFCVGKMFYIPTRNSRKSYYKWLRVSQFCVCLCAWSYTLSLSRRLQRYLSTISCYWQIVPSVSLVLCCVGDYFPFPPFFLLPCLLADQTLRHWSTF